MEHRVVLLVEDNEELNEINYRALVKKGYEVLTAKTLAHARGLLATHTPDVILLDVMLPDGNGIDFCGEIRTMTDAHILFLTSSAQHEQRVRGLDMGGDDYITKPYSLDELLSRVASAMRRREMSAANPETVLTRGALTLDTVAMQAFINGEDMLLTPKEFALLHLLMRNEGRTLTKEYLYENVWKQPINNNAGTLWTHISILKGKLGGSGVQITSERGAGYRFERI